MRTPAAKPHTKTNTHTLESTGVLAVQRATLQPSGQRCSPVSSMVRCGLPGDGTGAYFTGGDIQGICDCQGRRVEGEKGRGGTEKGGVGGKRLTGTCDMEGNLTALLKGKTKINE